MTYKFSERSLNKLGTCDERLQELFLEAIKLTPIDFGISEGYRDTETQQKYFKEGKSKLDGVNNKSKHNYLPSRALDLYAYVGGKASWDKIHLSTIYGVVETIARQKSIPIRWGGNFKSFLDMPHYELI
jgi:peptidoglycan L-alanyl-D-glutamate endopeptidase CwlK